jgi:hypothetical protein
MSEGETEEDRAIKKKRDITWLADKTSAGVDHEEKV